MNTSHNHTARPTYASPYLWAGVVLLGLNNVALQLARSKDFLDRNDRTWLEFGVGMCALALIIWAAISFIRTRRHQTHRHPPQ